MAGIPIRFNSYLLAAGRVILDFRYIGVFHILSVFIILGIGADDVFIFFDAWKETAHSEVQDFFLNRVILKSLKRKSPNKKQIVSCESLMSCFPFPAEHRKDKKSFR